ncbi:MAG: glycerophosphodiester phosphodiesterase family protein [Christensenellales bacterium]
MKVCVIQPGYSVHESDMEKCYRSITALMDTCDDSLDLIVLPEYCDVPAATGSCAAFQSAIQTYNADIYRRCADLAKRCCAIVCANFAFESDRGYRNTTYVFDRNGREVGRYYKAPPAPSEIKPAHMGGNGMDCEYAEHYAPPYTLEIEGLKLCFLTCYDFYMYESFARIALEKPDVLIGCSHQRTDTHETLETIGKFLCYNTNAWLVRSAVSMGEESAVCGCSMVVSPKGEIVLNMKNEVGLGICELDPMEKHLKPAGFQGKPKSHPEYIEDGRRPWLYRNGGSMMIPTDEMLPYPRVCAHRGFSTVAPENSMPAFGAAVALGAEEIEFDLWATKDGEIVSLHDSTLDRVSSGTGKVWEHTYEELMELDFGSKVNAHFAGLHIVRFEEILRKFAGTVIMNIHVKIWDADQPVPYYEKIAALLRQYDCARHCYMMSTNDKALREFHEIAPEIRRCVGFDGNKEDLLSMPKRVMALGCEKIQLFKPYFNRETVDLAKQNGILMTVFFADEPEEALRYLDMGINTILSNDYWIVAEAVRKWKEREHNG